MLRVEADWSETHVEAVSKADSSSSSPSRQYLNGRTDMSTLEMVSVMISVPALMLHTSRATSVSSAADDDPRGVRQTYDCSLNLSIISGPMIPLGNPGKFSTSVVVVSCPPAANPLASIPSNMMGFRLARAA